MRWSVVVAVVALSLGGALADQRSGIVVVDANTVEVGGQTWRLAGGVAPEIAHAKCDAERKLGERARSHLAELTAKGAEARTKGERDAYGRVVGTLLIGGRNSHEVLAADKLSSVGSAAADYCGGQPKTISKTEQPKQKSQAPRPPAPPPQSTKQGSHTTNNNTTVIFQKNTTVIGGDDRQKTAAATKAAVPSTGQCGGLVEAACAKSDACRWVAGYVRASGVAVEAYCRKR